MREELSRRAFRLDSRTTWVEQQHSTKGGVRCNVARDNFPLGPGEYNPDASYRAKHTSTPKLGWRPMQIDNFIPWRAACHSIKLTEVLQRANEHGPGLLSGLH